MTLLLLTGCRKSEITFLRWSEVKGSRLLLDDSKTGGRTVWLGDAARAILNRIGRGKPDEPVFPFKARSRSALNSFWCAIRKEAGIPDVRLHDLRHSFASFAARRSETLPMIGKLLGHASIAATARYAHLDDSSCVIASARVAELISKYQSRACY